MAYFLTNCVYLIYNVHLPLLIFNDMIIMITTLYITSTLMLFG